MDIFSPTIIDNAIITGSNNASLLQVSSPSATSAFFISGSGRVGIGTTSPLSTLTVAGGDINIGTGRGIGGNFVGTYTSFITYHNDGLGFLQSASFGFRGSAYMDSISYPNAFGFGINDLRFFASTNGIAAPSEIMRIVGSTGFVGIGETSPSAKLEIKGSGATSATTALRVENSAATALLTMLNDGTSAFNTSHLYVSSSGRVGVGTTTPRELLHVGGGNLSLDSTRYIDFGNGNSRINDLGLVSGQGYSLRITTFGPIGTGTANSLTEKLRLTGSGSLGLGTDSPSARFHISGGFTDGNLMRVQSPTGAEYFFISASGNVGIGTNLPSADLHISGTSADNLLRVGSPTDSNILFITGSGRVGVGTSTPTSALTVSGTIESLPISTDEGGQLTLRAATGRSFRWNVDNYQDNFRIFRENDSDSSGGAVRILISGSSGNVGIHTTAPTEWIYLSTTPSSGKYLNIDATQTSNGPQQSAVPGAFNYVAGPGTDDAVLGLPNYWMEIKLDGNIVLIPCYVPQ